MKRVLVNLLVSILCLSFVMGFTPEQTTWLDEHGNTLRVGVEEDYPPFISSVGGTSAGISVEYMNLVGEALGITIQYSTPGSLPTLLTQAKEGAVDVVTSLTYTPARAEFLTFSKPYVHVPAGVFSTHKKAISLDFANEAKLKVAVGNGYGVQGYLAETYPDLVLVPVKNDLEGLKALQAGEVYLAVADLGSVAYLVEQEKLESIYLVSYSGFEYKLSFAFPAGSKVLVDAINEGITQIPAETKQAIEKKWLYVQEPPFYATQLFFFLSAGAMFLIGFFLYLHSLRNETF